MIYEEIFALILCFGFYAFVLYLVILEVRNWWSERKACKEFEKRQERYRRMI